MDMMTEEILKEIHDFYQGLYIYAEAIDMSTEDIQEFLQNLGLPQTGDQLQTSPITEGEVLDAIKH